MKHKKRYKRTGVGVELLCGTRVIADNNNRFTNFSITGCLLCGGEIMTTGDSPDTDMVFES